MKIKRIGRWLLSLALPLLVTWITPGNVLAIQAKVTICHVPPGNALGAHTIMINPSALSAHLAHGDYMDACQSLFCSPASTSSCYGGPAGTAGTGICREGTQTCNATGTGYGACLGDVTPSSEICGDGLDNDCDGLVDNGCVCTPQSVVSCYDGPAGTAGIGVCQAGSQTCNAAGTGYGACAGTVTPSSEICGDGLDNDCDGLADNGCVCTPQSVVSCYNGPAGTAGIGVCQAGSQTCNAAGTSYGACAGTVAPSSEICGDGLDNDCDGLVDNGCVCTPQSVVSCYDGPAGTAGIGVCQAGSQTCNAAGTGYGACAGTVTPSSEICGDGLDNDCDGLADETCICVPSSASACYSGQPSTEDVGICGSGVKVCNSSGTGYGICVGEVTPASEICGDGLDSDCDGISDNGCVCIPGSTSTCYGGPSGTVGVGACHAGTQTCNSNGTSYGACIGDVVPIAEVCDDQIDNDCDGAVDEDCNG